MDSYANERNDKLLSKKIDEEVKKFGILKNSFSKIADSELCNRSKNILIFRITYISIIYLALSKTRTSCFEGISKIEETDNSCMNYKIL
jgi:hypothetical protein